MVRERGQATLLLLFVAFLVVGGTLVLFAMSNALGQAAKNGGAPVGVAGQPITPGGSGITSAAVRHALPAPLVVLLVLLGLGGLAWAATVARARGIQPPPPVLRVLNRVFPRRA